uniref:Hematopoietic SH2 domain containing n=1 Tax=Amphiprion percula TaxID=161767 RepID=A0A3P8U755_AMPPE
MEGSYPSQEQHDAVTWFKKSQLQSVISNGLVPEWFHGIISRKTAEELLMSKPPGYFLIRVSESRIGYTLSYRADDRCRHFMIDVLEDGHYIILGEDRRHRRLQDLVDFHRRTPIMPFCQVLTVACGQVRRFVLHVLSSAVSKWSNMSSSSENIDYAELLFPQRLPTPNTRLLPNNSPSTTPPSPSTSTAPQQPAKNQEGKPSVITNLKNFKRKFQKNRSTSQDNTYAEINAEVADRSGNTESEYEEITGNPNLTGSPFSYTDVKLTDQMLPQEYMKPPPFAPGF